jgi:hypothetical protein
MALLLFRSPCDSDDDCKIKKGRLLRIKFITTTIFAGTVSLFIYVKKFKIITFAEIRLRLQGLCAYLFCYYVCHRSNLLSCKDNCVHGCNIFNQYVVMALFLLYMMIYDGLMIISNDNRIGSAIESFGIMHTIKNLMQE